MKQILIVILLVMFTLNVKSQTLDQDYITGIPTTTSFGGHPLGQDNDQGQSFTPYISGNLCQLNVLANIDDIFTICNPNDSVGLIIEIHSGDGFAGSILGVSDTLYSGVISNSILAFNFSTAIPISSGSAYTWELKRLSESCQDLSVSLEAEFNGSYAGGVAYNNGSPAGSGQDILFQTFVCCYGQALDQDYITGVPATTSFGGHPLGQDNDQGQSFTPYISGNLCQLNVLANIDDIFTICNPNDSVGLIIEIHSGDGFAGSILGVSDTLYSGVISNSILAFNFSTAIPISSGSAYTWELKRLSESCQDLSVSLEAEFNGSYAGGVAYNNGSPAGSGQDILFQTITCEEQITGVDTRTECNSYTWIDGNTYTGSNNSATFNIVGGAANGCDSLVTLDLTIINSATGTDTRTECNSYTWIDGNNYTASNNSATFNIVGGAANGCDSLVTLDLTINNVTNLTTNISGPTIIASNGNATYQWLDCDNNNSIILGATNQGYTPLINGNYAVELTENGCVDTTSCVSITTVSIMENSFGKKLLVYPNPTSGNFSVDLGAVYENTQITIIDISGKLIDSKTITQSQTLNLSIEEPAGIYIVSILTDDKKAVIRLIKE